MGKTEILKVSLKEYKKAIDEMKASLLGLEKDSEEYNKVIEEITKRQAKLDDVMKAGKKSVDAAEGSYQALCNQMKELKEVWKSTSSEAERNAIGKQIKGINDKLKSMDASIGNYQRNVGDYANAWTTAFNSIGGGTPKAIAGIQGLGGAFKALKVSMGWIGVVIGAVVGVFSALAKGISSSEENTRRFNKILAPFKALMDGVEATLQLVADGFLTLVEWIGEGISKFQEFYDSIPDWVKYIINPVGESAKAIAKLTGIEDSLNEKLKIQNQILEQQNKLTDKKRTTTKENAKLEAEMAEALAIYSDRTKTMEERTKALNIANAARKQIADNNLTVAQEELKLLQLQATNTANDAEMNDKLAEAEAKVTRATAEQSQALRENNDALNQANKERKRLLNERSSQIKDTASLESSLYQTYDPKWFEAKKKELELNHKMDVEKARTEIQDNKLRNDRISALNAKYNQDLLKTEFEYQKARFLRKKELDDEEGKRKQSLYGKQSKQYQKFLEDQAKAEKEFYSNTRNKKFNKKVEAMLGLDVADLEAYYKQLEATRNKHKAELDDVVNYWDGEKSKESNPEKQLEYELAKVVNIRERFKKQVADIPSNITIDEILGFSAFDDNGKFDEIKYENFMYELSSILLPDEDLASLQERVYKYNENVALAQDAIDDFIAAQQALAAQNELMENQNNTGIFGSSVWEEMIFNVEQARIELESIYKKDDETYEEYLNRKLQAEQKYTNAQKTLVKQQIQNIQQVAGATSSVLNSVAGAYQAEIQSEVERGKISEEEGEKQFKRVKAMQYAATWINTLSSVMQIMSDSSIPSYWVKVPLAAAQLAAGVTTCMQINKTKIGSADVNGGNGAGTVGLSNANVTPLLNEAADMASMSSISIDGTNKQSDTRVYILESDIQSSNNRVETRETNTTF